MELKKFLPFILLQTGRSYGVKTFRNLPCYKQYTPMELKEV